MPSTAILSLLELCLEIRAPPLAFGKLVLSPFRRNNICATCLADSPKGLWTRGFVWQFLPSGSWSEACNVHGLVLPYLVEPCRPDPKVLFCFGRQQLAPDFLEIPWNKLDPPHPLPGWGVGGWGGPSVLQGPVSWGRHGRSHLSWWGDCQADTTMKLLPRVARGWLSSWRHVLQDNPVATWDHKCVFFGARWGRPLGAAWQIRGHRYGIKGGQRIGEVSGGTDWWTDYLSTLVIFFYLDLIDVGLACDIWCTCWPGRSVVGPADTGPSPCADVRQPDFGWSVRPPATLIARADEGMGHPWGSLCSPKVISHWVYPNWTENWCTRPPAMLIAWAGRYWGSLRGPMVLRRWVYPTWTENRCTRPACYSRVATIGWGARQGGWGGPVCNRNFKLLAVGVDGERPQKLRPFGQQKVV